MITFDIGLPEGHDDSIPILTDHVARMIMDLVPVDHRASLVRAINNASEVIAQANDDYIKLQVLRGAANDGVALSLSLTFIDLDEGDFERRMILQGRLSRLGMIATSELIRIDDAPESLAAQMIPGRAVKEIIDASPLEGLTIARHSTARSSGKTSLEIMLEESAREDIEEIVWKWNKRD